MRSAELGAAVARREARRAVALPRGLWDARVRIAPWLRARGDQFRARPAGDSARAAVVREIQRALQFCSRLHAPARPTQRGAVVRERSGKLDRRLRALQCLDRLGEELKAGLAALH